MDKLYKQILDILPGISLAILGGIAKLFIGQEKITFRILISSIIVSGFVGALTALLLQPLVLHPAYVAFICSMSGHSAGLVLVVYEKKVESFLENIGNAKNDKN